MAIFVNAAYSPGQTGVSELDGIDKLKHISSYISKLLRRNFGRGPDACYASVGNQFLVVYVRGFLSPMEDILVKKDPLTVSVARKSIIGSALNELKGVIHLTLDVEVLEFYHDWNFPNNTGMIVALLDRKLEPFEPVTDGPIPDFSMLEEEVARLSALVQKVPDQMEIVPIHSRLYIVVREGILIPIEKALIHRGFEQELLFVKDDLEKTYFHRDGRFQQYFGRDVLDIFFTWNLARDKSYIGFILK
ncbi:DUF2294 domain-containing protein [Paenibacillus turpanensis]|uniref:DUF2294 domain-containing protein n=1 Tax=Paenibacillus turpanensis TaxID=2689078 RepID=UPI001FB67A8B|nr:Na-translocating system protein MpsC family protein [Paenibacillus turpanensis]